MQVCDEVWNALDKNFKAFMDCMGQLTEEEIVASPACGIWTVKDVVAHVWCWLEEAVHTVKLWQQPRPWQKDGLYDDAWNEAQVASRAALPLIAVVDGITGAHRQLMHQLDLASEETIVKVGRAPWGEEMTLIEFFDAMAQHYADHVADLKAYQERCLEGCD